MVALEIADPFGAQQRRLLRGLDPLGDETKTGAPGKADQMAQHCPVRRARPQQPHQGGVELDRIDRKIFEMAQGGMASAKIVERDPAAGRPDRIDEAGRLFKIAEGGGFRDLYDQTRGRAGGAMQPRNQMPQPETVARRQAGDIEAELDPGMAGKLAESHLENVPVDRPDRPPRLKRCDRLADRPDRTVFFAHPQQALEVIDLAGHPANDRLEGEEQSALPERRLDPLAEAPALLFFLHDPVSDSPAAPLQRWIRSVEKSLNPYRMRRYARSGRRIREQERQDRVIELAGADLIEKMAAARKELDLRARDQAPQLFGKIGRRDDVVFRPDDQGWQFDAPEIGGAVEGQHRIDATGDHLDRGEGRKLLRLKLAQSLVVAGNPPAREEQQCRLLQIQAGAEPLQDLLAQREQPAEIGVRLGPGGG